MVSQQRHSKILVVTSVDAERDAVQDGFGSFSGVEVIVTGVGAAAAAAGTAARLAAGRYDLAVCAGIAGGFAGQAEPGTLAAATEIVAADLGAETPAGFTFLDELGFGSTRRLVNRHLVDRLVRALTGAGLPVVAGPILTVSTVTGTAQTAAEMAARVPGAAAEAMEGYGVATAAENAGVPFCELRAISNRVGPRDRSAWRIEEALTLLTEACHVLSDIL